MIKDPSRRPIRGYGLGLTKRDDGLLTLLPSLDAECITGHVGRWRFAGHGERPIDHVGRDLLLGSMARDYRAWPTPSKVANLSITCCNTRG
jgi:hypothetical protein